jgi:putative endonuclease
VGPDRRKITRRDPSQQGLIRQRLIRQRQARGRIAEDAAADFLHEHGYDILARNVRVGRLEIDLLARDGSAVVVVEVRTRQAGSWFGGIGSVTLEKRRRLRRAGQSLWMSRFAADATVQTMRFDIVSVHLEADSPPRFEHIRAAF